MCGCVDVNINQMWDVTYIPHLVPLPSTTHCLSSPEIDTEQMSIIPQTTHLCSCSQP